MLSESRYNPKHISPKTELEYKYRTARDHFMCEWILDYCGYGSAQEFSEGIVEKDLYPNNGYERFKCTNIILPSVRVGAIQRAAKKFGLSNERVAHIWRRCIIQEYERGKALNSDREKGLGDKVRVAAFITY